MSSRLKKKSSQIRNLLRNGYSSKISDADKEKRGLRLSINSSSLTSKSCDRKSSNVSAFLNPALSNSKKSSLRMVKSYYDNKQKHLKIDKINSELKPAYKRHVIQKNNEKENIGIDRKINQRRKWMINRESISPISKLPERMSKASSEDKELMTLEFEFDPLSGQRLSTQSLSKSIRPSFNISINPELLNASNMKFRPDGTIFEDKSFQDEIEVEPIRIECTSHRSKSDKQRDAIPMPLSQSEFGSFGAIYKELQPNGGRDISTSPTESPSKSEQSLINFTGSSWEEKVKKSISQIISDTPIYSKPSENSDLNISYAGIEAENDLQTLRRLVHELEFRNSEKDAEIMRLKVQVKDLSYLFESVLRRRICESKE